MSTALESHIASEEYLELERKAEFKSEYYNGGLPSLREYVRVAQESMSVERYCMRQDGSWLYASYASPQDNIPLQSIGCSVPMQEVYFKVEFPHS